MPEVLFRLDPTRKFTDQEKVGHNRWHPDIPPVATVRPGQTFRVHCREWFDGWMRNDDSAEDVRDAPLSIVHALSGPFAVDGAEPGDLLIVDILDVGPMAEDSGPLAGMGWGYTGIFAKRNGGGFLTDEFPDAYKAVWDFRGQQATSRHVPGVTFTGMIHSGLMGTAPSADLLARWNEREARLIATDPDRVPPLALPPEPRDAILGTLSGDEFDRVAREAARTAPPRENGGNQDIKNLTKGTRAFYPVYVPGAKFSVGDLHFSQGDGEITFCGAIEMSGYIDFHMDLIKDGMNRYGVSENTIFLPGNTDPRYCQWLAFSGLSVTPEGEQRYLDSQLAYKRACLHAIDYLTRFGYTPEQVYLLLGAAPIEGRFSGVVDIPNSCATVYIPTEIFDFDVRPNAKGTARIDPGRGAPRASF
ncbi:acetamidase/formamidase family protein [Planosporangium thailandense]|uniref:Acetamidase/formamidase family protein n=1 Tax=Planosporangium thailandense TaxID=765197 RepID=A0ABX0Y416_9ACTN|nr:formamidase [Planosporangium thailandense]NJC73127.1 acetamidase/formamidase family protein [Planosporangium thailandense]